MRNVVSLQSDFGTKQIDQVEIPRKRHGSYARIRTARNGLEGALPSHLREFEAVVASLQPKHVDLLFLSQHLERRIDDLNVETKVADQFVSRGLFNREQTTQDQPLHEQHGNVEFRRGGRRSQNVGENVSHRRRLRLGDYPTFRQLNGEP